tara:strand:+ start:72 stop:557 length:486 start_codon:yes stop_codon:yes gene_type:complete
MISDPQFWVAVAFIIFVIVVFNPVRKILTSSLDLKIIEIKNSIQEAEDLKTETQIVLSDIKKRQNEVKSEIELLHKNADEKIKIIEIQSNQKLKDLLLKKEMLAEDKIKQIARDANISIQKNISQTSIEATITILKQKLNETDKKNLINASIKELSSVIKS